MKNSMTDFWKWFSSNIVFAGGDPDMIATMIREKLMTEIPTIAIEVSRYQNVNEIIFSACGVTEHFDKIRKLIADAPKKSDFKFIALKPPRGFSFELAMGTHTLNAENLFFDPLIAKAAPTLLAIRMYIPRDILKAENVDGILRTIIETGIGEELASKISKVEIASSENQTSEALSISKLKSYVEWFFSRQN